MKPSSWIARIAAVAAIAIGSGVALSAPSTTLERQTAITDGDYRPGIDGVDLAAITGPARSTGTPACADPARRGNLRPCTR